MFTKRRIIALAVTVAAALVLLLTAAAQKPPQHESVGFTDTPMLPNLPWHVHDPNRPHPKQITPGATFRDAPSDAIILFDGKNLDQWQQRGTGADAGKMVAPKWKLGDGYFECVGNSGDLLTKEKFGDAQYHIEWSSPVPVQGESQSRGNSGILIQTYYETQVLDMWNNLTYADGSAGAIYGQWPPLVSPTRKPGEWNTYDIAFEAPVFENGQLKKPAYVTVFYNGVLVHHHKEIMGRMVYRHVATYAPHDAEMPLALQDHHTPVRYRNIWARKLKAYDQPER